MTMMSISESLIVEYIDPSKNALTLFKVCGSDLHTVRSGWVYPLDLHADLGTNNLSSSSRP
jgi:hypothetical protein